MTTAAVIVAAGRGRRVGGHLPKQWRMLAGRTVLARTLDAFRDARMIDRIILVLHPDDMALSAGYDGHEDVLAVAGGATRGASVLAGLEALEQEPPQNVLIHDAARPLVTQDIIARVCKALEHHEGAAPALAITDALWRSNDGALVGETVNRQGLFRAQTPQGFHYEKILQAHRGHKGEAADDVEIALATGLDVAIVAGSEKNLKITVEEDFRRAEHDIHEMENSFMDIRLGNGFDVHRFTSGTRVILCGVPIEHSRALAGHSDADVGMHALTDAIYGALADGDIGRHFPPSDPQWKGAASKIFLEHAIARARARGFEIANADITLICEEPRIGPHAQAMGHTLAAIMEIDTQRVSVKATTSETLGFTGRKEGIAALATVTLVKS